MHEMNIINNEFLKKKLNNDELDTENCSQLSKLIHLRLDYLNVCKILSLSLVKNLKSLNLSNNNISKIENISDLVNLEDLNLSFNKIEKIENLNSLHKIKKLSLYNNRISVIENLDTLVELRILSVGQNNIQNLNFVSYLRKFKYLRALNLANNPCSETDCSSYIYAYVPQLIYYNYRQILLQNKHAAYKKHELSIIKLENQEEEDLIKKENELLYARKIDEYRNMFLDITSENDVITLISQSDDIFLISLTNLENSIKNVHNTFYIHVKNNIENLIKSAKESYILRNNNVTYFNKFYSNIKIANLKTMRSLTEYIINLKLKYIYDFHQFENTELKQSLVTECLNIRGLLISKETRCSKDCVKLISKTKDKLMNNINNMFENVTNIFTNLRTNEQLFTQKLLESILYYFKAFGNNDINDEQVIAIISDRDLLKNRLGSLKYDRLKIINDIEKNIHSCAESWVNLFYEEFITSEVLRHENAVNNINDFINLQTSEIDQIHENKVDE